MRWGLSHQSSYAFLAFTSKYVETCCFFLGPYYAPLVGSSVTGTSFVSAYLYWRNGQFWLAYAVDSRGSKPNNYNLTLTVLLTRDLLTTKTGTCQVLTTRTSSESLVHQLVFMNRGMSSCNHICLIHRLIVVRLRLIS